MQKNRPCEMYEVLYARGLAKLGLGEILIERGSLVRSEWWFLRDDAAKVEDAGDLYLELEMCARVIAHHEEGMKMHMCVADIKEIKRGGRGIYNIRFFFVVVEKCPFPAAHAMQRAIASTLVLGSDWTFRSRIDRSSSSRSSLRSREVVPDLFNVTFGIRDEVSPFALDDFALPVQKHKRRDRSHAVFRSQLRFLLAVHVRERDKRHLTEVLVERRLFAVRGHKDDLELRVLFLELFVRLAEHGRERATWRTPVRAKVDPDDLLVRQHFGRWLHAVLGQQFVAEKIGPRRRHDLYVRIS